MRANANATILNKGTAIENPEIKKEVQFVSRQMNFFFARGGGCGGATLFPEFRRWVGPHQVIVSADLWKSKKCERTLDATHLAFSSFSKYNNFTCKGKD